MMRQVLFPSPGAPGGFVALTGLNVSHGNWCCLCLTCGGFRLRGLGDLVGGLWGRGACSSPCCPVLSAVMKKMGVSLGAL